MHYTEDVCGSAGPKSGPGFKLDLNLNDESFMETIDRL